MAILNRRAIQTTVQKTVSTSFVDLNRAIALINDTTIVTDAYKLYTSLAGVSEDFSDTDEFYKLADAFYSQNSSGRLYAVPVTAETIGGDKDLIATIANIESLGGDITFIGILFDRTFDSNPQIVDGSITTAVFGKEYHLFLDTSEADTLTSATTDKCSVNGAIINSFTGDNALKIGNVSFTYCASGSYASAEMLGALLSQDIGSKTAKFIKFIKSDIVDLTADQFQNLLNKRCNVFTGQSERAGQAFLKEGVTLKEGDFIDTSLGSIWITINLDNNLYDLFTKVKITINDDGFAMCKNKVSPIFGTAVEQGIINGSADTPYEIVFTAGDLENREIIGTYNYVEGVAGHFITNTITVSTEE
jgi:hypothetical protein